MVISKSACFSLPIVIVLLFNQCVSAHQNQHQELKQSNENRQPSLDSVLRVRRTYIDENENCGPHDLEMVHTIMDRICMLCHELHSHFAPNTRVECRKDCFHNTTFQSCMKIFSGSRNNSPRHHAEPTAPVPLYTEEVQTLDDLKERRRRM